MLGKGLQGNANYSLDRMKKRTKGVKISQLNVVSLRKHKIEVAKLLHDYRLDILGLNETRLVNLKIGMTDHYMVFGIRKLNANLSFIPKQIKAESCNMKNYNREAFLLDLQSVDWEMTISTDWDEPNIMANKFCDIFHSILS